MVPLVQALLLLACIAWTARGALRERRRPTGKQVVLGVVAGLVVAGAAGTTIHMCDKGQAFTQWLIPSACLTATLLFVRPSLSRRISCGVLVALAFALSFQYASYVHDGRYVGTPVAGTREWHTPLTGLYRCRPTPPPGT